MMEKNFVELFAGAGGLSEGFIESGLTPIAFVEQDAYCCQTLETRMIYHHLKRNKKLSIYYDYIKGNIVRSELLQKININVSNKIINKKISATTLEAVIRDIQKLLNGNALDLLLGGPPCQAYSLIGRAQNKHKKNDERLHLYKYYIEILKAFNPNFFIFENVPGLLSIQNGMLFKSIIFDFKNLGYFVNFKIVDASDYGVLQKRNRLIVVGSKKKDVNINLEKIDIKKYCVNDLFSDLAPINVNETRNEYITIPTEYLKKTGIRDKTSVLSLHSARTHNARDLSIYMEIISYWNMHHKRLKYSSLPEILRTHKNISSFLDRFKVVAGDLQTSHTMVAHIAKDGHHYIHPDLKQCRSISIREAARIQSFPDNYFFEGPRTAQLTQIGNAVPVLLSNALAKSIKEEL